MVLLLLYFFYVLSEMGMEEVWVTFGKGESYHVISIHSLFAKSGKQICMILPIVHILAGSDVTSKMGIKKAALKCHFSQLVDFGSCQSPQYSSWQKAIYVQCFLQRIIKRHFDDLRYILYTKKENTNFIFATYFTDVTWTSPSLPLLYLLMSKSV